MHEGIDKLLFDFTQFPLARSYKCLGKDFLLRLHGYLVQNGSALLKQIQKRGSIKVDAESKLFKMVQSWIDLRMILKTLIPETHSRTGTCTKAISVALPGIREAAVCPVAPCQPARSHLC